MFQKGIESLARKMGVGVSLLCAIHCLSMPFLFVFAPFLAEFISHDLEFILLVFSAILAKWIFLKDQNVHKSTLPVVLAVVSSSFSFMGVTIFHSSAEVVFMVLGGIFMLSAYIINWRMSQKCAMASS